MAIASPCNASGLAQQPQTFAFEHGLSTAAYAQLGKQVMQVPLDGGLGQMHRLGDIAIRQPGRYEPQDFSFSMANILIFIETFRVDRQSPALFAKRFSDTLPGGCSFGLGTFPSIPERQQPQSIVLKQPAIAALPSFLQRRTQQREGFFAVTFASVRHRK